MTTSPVTRVDIDELCARLDLSRETVLHIMEHGIIEPLETGGGHWVFDGRVTVRISRAVRLRQDLDMDWSGVALALELLEELESVREENHRLRRRLERFLDSL